jgi:hypothetical protein
MTNLKNANFPIVGNDPSSSFLCVSIGNPNLGEKIHHKKRLKTFSSKIVAQHRNVIFTPKTKKTFNSERK